MATSGSLINCFSGDLGGQGRADLFSRVTQRHPFTRDREQEPAGMKPGLGKLGQAGGWKEGTRWEVVKDWLGTGLWQDSPSREQHQVSAPA